MLNFSNTLDDTNAKAEKQKQIDEAIELFTKASTDSDPDTSYVYELFDILDYCVDTSTETLMGMSLGVYTDYGVVVFDTRYCQATLRGGDKIVELLHTIPKAFADSVNRFWNQKWMQFLEDREELKGML